MSDQAEYPVRLRCSKCRWIDVAYTERHHGSIVKLGHKVNRESSAERCSGIIEVLPKGVEDE